MSEGRRLLLFEWVMLAYTVFTLLLMAVLWRRLVDPASMLWLRAVAVALTLSLWQLSRRVVSGHRQWGPPLVMLRVAVQLLLLSWWYPDTYEFNRLFPCLDHLFAQWEQTLFGCQPALLFSQQLPSLWVSEPLCLGYVSYYPMIAAVTFFFFFCRYPRFTYAAFVILGSFFLFYVVFIFLPVAGPQFYYEAVGTGQIAQGIFPDLGHYFLDHQQSLPIPGSDGLFHYLVQDAHDAGERPTAAFPSSHVGISVVLLWLAWESRSRRLFFVLLPLTVLMFFATFYIQAHYVIDAVAGIFVGTAFYFLLSRVYQKASSHWPV